MTPFEFVLIFFIGGLALTAMVGDEVSYTNAICQIITLGFAHYTLAWARTKSKRLARLGLCASNTVCGLRDERSIIVNAGAFCIALWCNGAVVPRRGRPS